MVAGLLLHMKKSPKSKNRERKISREYASQYQTVQKKWNIADCRDMNPLQYSPDFVEVRAALKRNGAALRFTVRRSAFQLHWDSSLVKLLSRVLVDNGKGQRIQMRIQIDLPGLKSDETQEFIFGSGLCHLGASKHVLWEVEP